MKKLSLPLLAETVLSRRKEKRITQEKLSGLTGINRALLSPVWDKSYMEYRVRRGRDDDVLIGALNGMDVIALDLMPSFIRSFDTPRFGPSCHALRAKSNA